MLISLIGSQSSLRLNRSEKNWGTLSDCPIWGESMSLLIRKIQWKHIFEMLLWMSTKLCLEKYRITSQFKLKLNLTERNEETWHCAQRFWLNDNFESKKTIKIEKVLSDFDGQAFYSWEWRIFIKHTTLFISALKILRYKVLFSLKDLCLLWILKIVNKRYIYILVACHSDQNTVLSETRVFY